MVSEECVQCDGKGLKTFHKGTPRAYEAKCPCCRGEGIRIVNGKIEKKIVEEE